MNRSLFFFSFFLLLFVSCKKDQKDVDMENSVVTDRNFANQLKASPTYAVISGVELALDAYPCRDYMSGEWGEQEGSPLMAFIKFVGQDCMLLIIGKSTSNCPPRAFLI